MPRLDSAGAHSGADPACSLGSAELADRFREWHSLLVGAERIERVSDRHFVAVFTRVPEVTRRLRELIQAEARCCPFLDLRIRDEDVRVRLEVMSTAVRVEDAARRMPRALRPSGGA